MVALENSYDAELSIFMDSVSVTSSLNDIRLLEAKSCKVNITNFHSLYSFKVNLGQIDLFWTIFTATMGSASYLGLQGRLLPAYFEPDSGSY